MITNHKISKAEYCKPFEVEGDPVLSSREGYRPGFVPSDLKNGGSVENLVLAFLKEQLEAVKQKALDPSAAVETAIGMMAKAHERALEIAAKQVPQQASPTETLTSMISSLEKLGLIRKEDAVSETLKELLQELRAAKEEKPRSVWEELKAAKDGLSMLGYGRGGGNGENSWVAVAQALAPALEKIADKALAVISARQSLPVPRLTTPAPVPLGATPAPLPGPSPAPPAPLPTVPSPEQEAAFASQVVSGYLFGKIRQRFDEGQDGDVVAEWLDDTERPMANQLGYLKPEQLLSIMRQHPLFAPVADHPRMATFIAQFLDYFRDAGEPESEKQEEGKKVAA